MMYKSNFVVCLKVDGKILRDRGSEVILPFGSEYTVLLKNLESRKAVVSVEIDGEDVLDGDRLIVDANSEVELEGFKKKNKVTNRFKFIEKTEEISDYRGDKAEDGLIRVEVQWEQKEAEYNWAFRWDSYPYQPLIYYCSDSIEYSSDNTLIGSSALRSAQTSFCCNNVETQACCDNEDGITVKGSDDVDQNFVRGYTRSLENNKTVIVLQLKGKVKNKKVVKITTTKDKLKCPTCGRKSSSNNKYCGSCGTFLEN